ncbi:MAG TPA: glycoside hydrolase domain-containing protein, partial [Spirochaetia bacterium]|nr:glycoside hydrolase domain-containing protein [Spirochaetia bacterium]
MRVRCWLQDSLLRIYPTGNRPADQADGQPWLEAGRGERLSFQLAIESLGRGDPARVSVSAAAPPGIAARVRRLGFVPVPYHNTETPDGELDSMDHIPGYVPDPLFEESQTLLPAGQTAAFWITVRVDRDAKPGRFSIPLSVLCQGESVAELTAEVIVHEARIAPRKDFPVTHWFYADAILDWYRLSGFEERFWTLLRQYLVNVAEHGQDTIYVPALTPPLDGVKRPTQLVAVQAAGERYAFDWSLVQRYVRLARDCGIDRFEWPHLFTQWGVANAIRVYHGRGEDER